MSDPRGNSGWSLVTLHAGTETRILLGDPVRCLGLTVDCLSGGLAERVIGKSPSPCPWQEPTDSVRYLLRDHKGHARWVESQSERDSDGHLVVATREYLPAFDDDTLVQLARMTLSASLLGGFAHEINNIVQGISAAEYLFRDCVESGDEIEVEDLDHLAQTASSLGELGMAMQKFTRTPLAAAVPTDLPELIADTVTFLQQSGKLKHMKLDVELAEALPMLHWRKADLGLLLTAVLANAADAATTGPEKPAIRISAVHRDDAVEICVEDNGKGFADDSQSRKPFVTTKDRDRHLGLGLSTVAALIATRGGSLQISRGEADGRTCTQLVLPVTAKL